MADAVIPAAEDGEQGQQAGGVWSMVKNIAYQILCWYLITSVFKVFFGSPRSVTGPVTGFEAQPSSNLYKLEQEFDMYLYLDGMASKFDGFNDTRKHFWIEKGIKYGAWSSGQNKDGIYTFHKTLPTPEQLWKNDSIYLHVFITKAGHSPDPAMESYLENETMYNVRRMNKYKKKYYQTTANLLTGRSEQSEEDLKKAATMKYEVLNFWHPNITINLIVDQTTWIKGRVPAPFDEVVRFDTIDGYYFPIFSFNDFWNLGSGYTPINETVKEINLTVTYQPLSIFKYQLYASQMKKSQWSTMVDDLFERDDDGHDDSLKQALLETNPILLGITFIVSILHSVLEFLAFKNDIQFWRTRKDLVGLSVRTILFNIFQSAVVFLYICDNDTNFVVKMSVGFGLLIECWKIPKVLNMEIDRENKIAGLIPRIKFSDKGSYVESDTKEYDKLAFKYLSWVLFPLLGGYAIYSIIYVEQRGWYSWVLNMLYGFLLTFGFIAMTPQLFINYKMKSVAHLPWRMLTYKFVNTIIDDLFAFVIRTPMLYRIACFRDDIIFLIYLYQSRIYRVDPSRVNEFGVSMENPTGAKAIADVAEELEAIAEEESKKNK